MQKDSPLETDFPITIGGKKFTLSFPIEALWIFEDLSGQKLFDDARSAEEMQAEFAKLSNRQKIKRSIDLLYAGLATHHPDLTRDQVGKMVHLPELADIDKQVSAAYSASMPKPKDEADVPLAQGAAS